MQHIKRFNELFSTIGSLIGKGSALVSGITPKISILDKFNKKDRDLGKEILNHINNMSREYNRSGVYNPATINQSNNNWYYFIDKIFKGSGDNYKVDIIKHLDYKTTNRPEYTISLSKSGIESSQYSDRLSGREIRVRDTVGGKSAKRSYGNSNVQSKGERLDIDQGLASSIYNAAESVWKSVNKNIRDDARGK
jgi:hypothetical protein